MLLPAVLSLCTLSRTAGESEIQNYSLGIALQRLGGKCGIIVGSVGPASPGEKAHIKSGDRLIAVGGKDVSQLDLRQVAALLHSGKPEAVRLTLERPSSHLYTVRVRFQPQATILARSGLKAVKGVVVPLDTTEQEVQQMLNFEEQRIAHRLFPLHYPSDPSLFCPGFEIFVLRDSLTVMIGGIEHGPASQAGVHWGDIIENVNGTSLSGKSPQQIETLFTSPFPALMELTVNRLGSTKSFRFSLVRASTLLKLNHKRLAGSNIVPEGITDRDLNCRD